ncbi:MAG: VanW family protein [Lachnospiraceae bacterium]|nr:VanW family protein [Lachnospiraceae bacterium]
MLKKSHRFSLYLLAVLLTALVFSAPLSSGAQVLFAPTQPRQALYGITIDHTPIGGKTKEEVKQMVEEKIRDAGEAVITLYAEGEEDGAKVSATANELGLSWRNPSVADEALRFGQSGNIISRYKEHKDLEEEGKDFPIQLKLDEEKVLAFVKENASVFNRGAVEGTIRRENGELTYVAGIEGHEVEEEASAKKISRAIADGWRRKDIDVALSIKVEKPRGTEEELSQVRDLLGYYTTNYQSSGNARSMNIANGCKLVSGYIVYPGEVFSVLSHLIPFTEENGYALAGSYLGTKVVDSLGGGICQVSTTLYNAVIRAELGVIERSNHSMIVSYVDPSMDAAIAESTGMDFKFENITKHPVYIEGYTADKLITFNIFGVDERPEGRKVSFESEVLETIPSEGVEVEKDATEQVGYVAMTNGHTGYKAQLWKIVTQDGEVISREVFNKSNYKSSPALITVGTAGNVTPELASAMDTGDVETIRVAAANAAASQVATDMLTEAAGEAAQAAYAEALSQGYDPETAKAKAQDAANEVVESATAEQNITAPEASGQNISAESEEQAIIEEYTGE